MLHKVILAKPRGFCAGVVRAIEVVEQSLERFPGPVYVRKEIVHNPHVVNALRTKGARFVDELTEVPEGATTIFSAHGVSPAVHEAARTRRLRVVDATCPLVTKVHVEAKRFEKEGYTILLIGHQGHEEVEGTMGEVPGAIRLVQTVEEARAVTVPDPGKVAVITQTTLSVDDTREVIEVLKRRFPRMVTPAKEDICYATQNRQDAVKRLAREVDLVLVIGSRNSENSNQLVKVARSLGKPAYLIDDHHGINPNWLAGALRVGITSGASVPDQLVQEAAEFFKEQGAEVAELGFIEENIHFALPPEIARK